MDPTDPSVVHLVGPERKVRHDVRTLCGWLVDERQKNRLTHNREIATCDACVQQADRDEDITAGLTTSAEGGV